MLTDLKDKQFGRLVVLKHSRRQFRSARYGYRHFWVCQCICGNVKEIDGAHLASGHTRSCGCWHAERTTESNTIHGKSGTYEYRVWKGMNARCYSKKNSMYRNYGKRGIFVCDRWRRDFAAFLADMGLVPSPKHSLDRIDPNGPYSPDNCRWATKAMQTANRRRVALESIPESELRAELQRRESSATED